MTDLKEDTFKYIRYILDFVYLVQKMRGLSVLSEYTNSYTDKNETKEKLIHFVKDYNYQKSDSVNLKFYLDILFSIEEKNHPEALIVFSDYTNLIINPLINKITKILSYEADTQTEKYLSLIYLIEELSIKRGTMIFFANKNNQIPVDYILSIANRYGELGKLIFDFIEDSNLLINNNFNIKFINPQQCFNTLTVIINNFINLEKETLIDLYSYIDSEISLKKLIDDSKTNSLFSSLSKREICNLFQKGKILHFNKNEVIPFIENTVYFCLKGKIKISKINIKGNEGVIDLCKKDDLFFSKFFPKEVSIVTLANDTIFFTISEKVFKDILHKNITMLDNFLKYQEDYIIRKNNYLENLNCHEAKERLALFLTENTFNKPEETFDKASIARFLNMRPETFSRALKEINSNLTENNNYLCNYCSKFNNQTCLQKSCPSLQSIHKL